MAFIRADCIMIGLKLQIKHCSCNQSKREIQRETKHSKCVPSSNTDLEKREQKARLTSKDIACPALQKDCMGIHGGFDIFLLTFLN